MSEKIYVGNGKVITTQYGDLMKLSFTEEDVKKLRDSLDNGWVNLVVKERKEPSAKGTTHYLEVDTWKPEGGGKPVDKSFEAPIEDLPF